MCSQRKVILLACLWAASCSAQIQRNQVRLDPYSAAWNGDRYRAGSADAVYDKIQSLPPIAFDANMILFASTFGVVGNGVTDDANNLQAALDAAIATGKTLFIRRPAVAYRINHGLTLGDGLATQPGLRILGDGLPKILWGKATGGTMLTVTSVDFTQISNLWFDGNDVPDVNGVKITNTGAHPSLLNIFDNVYVWRCGHRGIEVIEAALMRGDNVTFRECDIEKCGTNLYIAGGAKQIDWHGGVLYDANDYNVILKNAQLLVYDTIFGRAGVADVYLDDPNATLKVYGGISESNEPFLKTSPAAAATGSYRGANLITGFHNEPNGTMSTAVIDYNMPRPLVLLGCKLRGNVQLGTQVPQVQSLATEFTTGDFNGLPERVVETRTPIRLWSLTIDDPNRIVDPNLMMLPVDSTGFPYGLVVTAIALKTRGSTTYTLTVLDYNSPTDASPDTIGTVATAGGTEGSAPITPHYTIPAGDILFIRVPPGTGLNQLQAIVYGYPKVR
jgi:hypothetical protein